MPTGPPANRRNGSASCGSAPPSRAEHDAAPQQHDARSRGGLERAASPSRGRRAARKSLPAGVSSVIDLIAVHAVDPDRGTADERPPADAWRRRWRRPAPAWLACGWRGSRACARRSSGVPAIDAPARLITASDRSSACRHVVSVGLVDQSTSPSRCGRLVRIITRCPAARKALARAVPRKPLPPAINRVMRTSEGVLPSLTRPRPPIY